MTSSTNARLSLAASIDERYSETGKCSSTKQHGVVPVRANLRRLRSRTVWPGLMAAVRYDGSSGMRPPLNTRLTALGSELRNTISMTSPTCQHGGKGSLRIEVQREGG